MREAVFVRRHAADWQAFERELEAGPEARPEALAAGYVRLGDDLAYAQTFYAGSPTEAYLNDLHAAVHRSVFRRRREERGAFVRFWTHGVPRAAWEARWALLAALVLFVGSIALGVASASGDADFARLVLSDDYVEMTQANIDRGDPMAVYKKMRPDEMTAYIALNNVLVSFLCFVGLFRLGGLVLPGFALGTAQILFSNGVMVGTFAHLFTSQGLGGTFARVVFIHGALELSAIVVAGGAGFAMGGALLVPGTFPRLESFRRGALRGLTLIAGLVPIFLAAAVLESVVTRQTEMPLWIAVAIIGSSFAFMIGYYAVWPWLLARRDAAFADGPPPPTVRRLDLSPPRSTGGTSPDPLDA